MNTLPRTRPVQLDRLVASAERHGKTVKIETEADRFFPRITALIPDGGLSTGYLYVIALYNNNTGRWSVSAHRSYSRGANMQKISLRSAYGVLEWV